MAQPITGVADVDPAAPVSSFDDHGLAAWLAASAGLELLKIRADAGFADPAALKKAGDVGSHEFLASRLARLRPGDAVLSEEGRDDPVRLTADRVWIVDPLDGTREFSEEGRTDWAVHVALWSAGELVAGAVSLPAAGVVYGTGAAGLASGGGVPGTALRVAASRSRPPAFLAALCERLGAVQVPMGSAGAKIMAVVSGEVDAYVHAGGQYEWDSAAPVAVARAAGLHTSRVDGSPLVYNRPDPLLPDLVVCHPSIAGPILRAVPDGIASA